MYEESLKHSADHNFPYEPICSSLGVTMDEEVKGLCESVLKNDTSLALISSQTGEIIGQRVLQIGSKNDKIDVENFKIEANRKLIKLFDYKNKLYFDIWENYGVHEAFELFGLSVHKGYRHKGIGLKIMQAAMLFIKSMNLGPVLVKGDCSSNFSQHIYERLDFDCLGKIKYEDYKVDGEQVITNTGEHKYLKVYGKMI